MPKPFGTTTHSDIMHAFEAEHRQHTYVEQLPEGAGYAKKYELRVTPEELLVLLDALRHAGRNTFELVPGESSWQPQLAPRQLRIKILATLGVYEEG